jgi:thiol-disulfide isomerase/thioredoxin
MKLFFSVAAILLLLTAYPQQAYKTGDAVASFTFSKVLNHTSTSSSLNNLKAAITIIDFFGTWCVPCIKALPHLTDLQTKYKNKISIVLVSNETTARLTKFITARAPFAFPVVADDENKFTALFQPPSYPYTVVLDKEGKIISITDAASLNENDINKWLTQKTEAVKTDTAITKQPVTLVKNLQSSNALVQLSQQFIYAAKIGEATDSFVLALKNLPYNGLKDNLQSDEEKKAFWINLYNGFTQLLLTKKPEKFKSRNKFFKSRQIEVAGKTFSLDNIEHGILRRSKIKWSLGYFSKWFPNKTEKELRVNEVDYRIHFTLNCGAKSCPPIAFYNPENLNPQMELATKAYLTGEAAYGSTKNTVHLPALMSWFRRDFGGKKKMKQLLQKINIIPAGSNPKIKFKKYNWDLFLNHYKTDN